MISGDIIRAKTNAELLNTLLGTHYQAWTKSVYEYANRRIWMIHIDNKNRNDWKNYKKGNIIVEENLRKYDFNGLRIDVRHNVERIVFSKRDGYFVFEGIYKYDKENSIDNEIRYWIKVSDQF